jgi:hypothetical protein
LDERQDLALEGGEVDEPAVLLIPFPSLTLAGDVRRGTSGRRARAMRRIIAGGASTVSSEAAETNLRSLAP